MGGAALVTCEFPPFPGGIGTYAGELSAVLASRGLSVVVVAPSYPDLGADDMHRSDMTIRRILGHHRIGARAIPALLSTLRSLPAGHPVLAVDIRSVIALYLLRPLHGRSFRAMVHGSEAAKFRPWSLPFLIAKRAYSAASTVLFNSNATRDIFERGFGRVGNASISYLGVDEFWFEAPFGPFEHPDLAALSDTETIVCSVGRLEPRKGHLQAIRALARLRDRHGAGNLVYVAAGKAESQQYLADIRREAEALSIKIIIPGRLSQADVRQLYRKALCQTLLASSLPGKVEGFGLVLLEAAAQGCPSVATACGGIPEALGQTGILVQEENLDEVADAIWNLLADTATRERLGQAARLHAREFTWARCADMTFPEFAAGR